LATRTGIL